MKKGLLCLLTAVALTAAVFGCGKRQSQSAGTAESVTQASETIVVSIEIDGSGGEDRAISAEGRLKLSDGSTVYDALQRLCETRGYTITGEPSYVKTIGGLGEGSFGAVPCGWMFSVGGNYPPEPADKYILKDGDKVLWEFVK